MRRRRLNAALRFSMVAAFLVGLGSAVGACSGDDDESGGGHGGTGGIVLVVGSGGSSAGDAVTGAQAGEATTGAVAAGGNEPAIDGGSTSGGSSSGSSAGGNVSSGGNGYYLPCASLADCKQYGGSKICCSASGMRFCTKQSACSGDVLP
jgi:hypothetical protein